MKVGILDSGVGGFTLLPHFFNTGHSIIYLADDKNMPYGNKSHSDLIKICSKNVRLLMDYGAECVIIMCNTLSSVAREIYKSKEDVIIIEPAINALRSLDVKKKALICTPVTASSVIAKIGESVEFDIFPLKNLAGVIEELCLDLDRVREYIKKSLKYLRNYDAVALGCTHYSLVKRVFEDVFPNIVFVDGTQGVFNRFLSIYGDCKHGSFELNIRSTSGGNMFKYYELLKKIEKI